MLYIWFTDGNESPLHFWKGKYLRFKVFNNLTRVFFFLIVSTCNSFQFPVTKHVLNSSVRAEQRENSAHRIITI